MMSFRQPRVVNLWVTMVTVGSLEWYDWKRPIWWFWGIRGPQSPSRFTQSFKTMGQTQDITKTVDNSHWGGKETMKNTSLTTHHFSVILPLSSPHLSVVSSALLLSSRSLSGSISPHCEGEEGLPPTWLWWEISSRGSSGAGGRKEKDKRPNKVQLNIETVRPFPLVLIKSCWWIHDYPPRRTETRSLPQGSETELLVHGNTRSCTQTWCFMKQRGQGA